MGVIVKSIIFAALVLIVSTLPLEGQEEPEINLSNQDVQENSPAVNSEDLTRSKRTLGEFKFINFEDQLEIY